ncbi:MAG: NAD(P)H-binding protein [Chloroflexota bacterium]
MPRDLVTGAFGYTGSRIAERLLDAGRDVVTLTRRAPGSHPLAERVAILPYEFDESAMARALAGIDTVYVTLWMRFPRGDATWEQMVSNVARLARSAAAAGVRRLVYISVSNAAHDSSTAYFRAKAAAEDAVREAALGGAMTYAIVRPTLLYGDADILINNMAWTLRRLPVFGIPGDGTYRVQPVLVDDVADLCVSLGAGDGPVEMDAAGPETLTFNEVVGIVRGAVRSRSLVVHMPPTVVLVSTRVIGLAVRDIVLTRDEIRELMESLLVSAGPPTTPARFSEWVAAHASTIGRTYSSELGRNFRFDRR